MDTIKKAFDTNNVAVLLTSSDLYAPYAGVVDKSLRTPLRRIIMIF